MTKNSKAVFFLHDDLIKLCTSFVWGYGGVSAKELSNDIEFYIRWTDRVPPIFLNCAVLETNLWIEVPNPMRRGHPYYPRNRLLLRPKTVWSDSMLKLGTRLCRERIRDCKTYKRCAIRWIQNCMAGLELWYFEEVDRKLFQRIKVHHFRSRSNFRFVRECLEQLSFLRRASVSLSV